MVGSDRRVEAAGDPFEIPFEYDGRLTAFDFGGSVALHHTDGSFFYWDRAFFTGELDDYWTVYTEHHGYHHYPKDEVNAVRGAYRDEGWVPHSEKVEADL